MADYQPMPDMDAPPEVHEAFKRGELSQSDYDWLCGHGPDEPQSFGGWSHYANMRAKSGGYRSRMRGYGRNWRRTM